MNLTKDTYLQGGKYKIIRQLGQGGFGVTYLAIQTALDRKVAVKEFFMFDYCNREGETTFVTMGNSSSHGIVEQYKRKFIKEAKTIASLDNPHIIRIYDVFEENGTAYYVMEYLEGGDLKSRIPAGGIPQAEAIRTIKQIAEGLQYLHAQKILHLDVKPTNILYRGKDTAVLIDFGLSKHYDGYGEQTSRTPLGISDGYAPLEQYEPDGITIFSPATDIYALGGTFYHMLTGKRPPSASQTIKGLPALPATVSKPTVLAIQAAMKPAREDRPQSIQKFLQMIDAKPRRRASSGRRSKAYYLKMMRRLIWTLIPVSIVAVLLTLYFNGTFSLQQNETKENITEKPLTEVVETSSKGLAQYIDLATAADGVYVVAKNGWGIPVEEADTSCIAVALIQGKHKFWIEKNGEENLISIKAAHVAEGAQFPNYTMFSWGMYGYDNPEIKETHLVGGNSSSYSWGYLPKADGSYFQEKNKLSAKQNDWLNGALADLNGKNNTKALLLAEDTCRNDMYPNMATYVLMFNGTQSENQRYTDWYIPTLGQLALMFLNKGKIDKALLKIGGVLFTHTQYWSSTEFSAEEGWGVNMGYGGVWHDKKNHGFSVRLVRDNHLNKVPL